LIFILHDEGRRISLFFPANVQATTESTGL
jgi:hypothetical protein